MMQIRIATIVAGLTLVGTPALAHEPPEETVDEAHEHVDASPESAEAYLERAVAYKRAGHFRKSLDDLRRAEELRGGASPEILRLRGEVRANLGRDKQAVADLTAFIERTGGTMDAHRLRGRIHEGHDRLEAALADYDAALAFGDHIDTYLARGRIQRAMGRLDEAARGYADGLEKTGAIVLREELVEVERRRGNYSRALAVIDGAIAEADVATRWFLMRAEVMEEAGHDQLAVQNRKRALADAERLVEVRKSPAALARRGEARLALGRVDEAIADLAQAVRRAPHMERARRLLATAKQQAGRED